MKMQIELLLCHTQHHSSQVVNCWLLHTTQTHTHYTYVMKIPSISFTTNVIHYILYYYMYVSLVRAFCKNMMTWGGKMMVLKAGYFLYQSIERLSLRVIIELQMTALPTADGNMQSATEKLGYYILQYICIFILSRP